MIRVELVSGAAEEFDPAPGRDFLVGPGDTFGDLAEAINTAFARWDISHLHEFRFPDRRAIGVPDTDWAIEQEIEDENEIEVKAALKPDDEFVYIFDFGDDWTHRCRVIGDIDPGAAYGDPPDGIVPIFGWGSIPDQYGRDRPDEAE